MSTGAPPASSDSDQVRLPAPRPRWRQRPGWLHLVLGGVLLLLWAGWITSAYRAELREVSMSQLRADLASGSVVRYSLVTGMDEGHRWAVPGLRPRVTETHAVDERGYPVDDRGVHVPVVAVLYTTDAAIGPQRFVRVPAGKSLTAEGVVDEILGAGVKPHLSPDDPDAYRDVNPYSGHAEVFGLAALLTALVLLVTTSPTRGTRWFWFFATPLPFGVGLLAFAALELIRPRPPTDRSSRRWSGWLGLAVLLGANFIVSPA